MKILITIAFTIITFQVIAQNKWSIGANASLDYCYRFYGNSEAAVKIKRDADNIEVGNLGYNSGFKFQYSLNENISIISGINYYYHSYKSNEIKLVSTVSDPAIPNSLNYIYKSGFIQIPLLISYYKGKKIKFGFTSGISFNKALYIDQEKTLNFTNRTETVISSQFTNRAAGKLYLAAVIGLGAEYNYKNYIFRCEPTAISQFYTIDGGNDLYLWNAGLNLSVFYKL